jgi:arabinogalactan oligomer / maltooligosaccharide transport system permease protein
MSITTTTAPTPVKVERMSAGRWVKTVGWRHVIMVAAVIFALFPIGYILNLAFAGRNTLTSACPLDYQGLEAITCLIPQPWTWSTANFTKVLDDEQRPFLVWFQNTMIIATVVSFVSVFMGAAAAFAFSRMRFTGRRPGLLALVLVQMFPAILALTAIFLLLTQIRDVFPAIGLNSIYGLILVYLGGTLGVNTYLMKGFFDTIPVEIDESARIDGASHVRIFFGMILRLAAPILTVVFFITFTGMFNELAIASVIVPNQLDTTLAVGLNTYVANPLKQEWGFFAAGALMAAVPMLIVFAIAQRQLVTGLTAGAVKG